MPTTFIGSDGVIRADAGHHRRRRTRRRLADGDTRFYARLRRKAARIGQRRIRRTSGKLGLDVGGHVNAGAPERPGRNLAARSD